MKNLFSHDLKIVSYSLLYNICIQSSPLIRSHMLRIILYQKNHIRNNMSVMFCYRINRTSWLKRILLFHLKTEILLYSRLDSIQNTHTPHTMHSYTQRSCTLIIIRQISYKYQIFFWKIIIKLFLLSDYLLYTCV